MISNLALRERYLKNLKDLSFEGEDYLVSWFDIEGREWFGDFTTLRDAAELFNHICENKVDTSQIRCELWSDIDNKILMKYDNIENKYYYC